MDATLLPPAEGEYAHKTDLKSVRRPRVELITRGERRRRWSIEQKQEIVAESLGADTTPTEVARKHAISSGLLYTWRQQLLAGQLGPEVRPAPSFAKVEIAGAPEPSDTRDRMLEPTGSAATTPVARPEGLIEIVLPDGVTLRVDAQVDGRALRRVLAALGPMIALAAGVRVYLACGVTDMRKGMIGLSMLVQQNLAEDPFGGAVFAFRGRRAGLIKLIWHDGVGLCMLTKRLERGQFAWPTSSTTGRIMLTSAQLAALLDGCEWRAPVPRRQPQLAG